MEKTTSSHQTKSFIGIYHPTGQPSWYYIGEWYMNNRFTHFDGILVRSNYNGMATRSFSFMPTNIDMLDVNLDDVKEIDPYKYRYVKRELNNLFEDLIKWINIIPEADAQYEDCEYRSAAIIFNEGTIFLSKEMKWRNDGTIIGAYYDCQHISYYKYDRQEPYYLNESKDFKDFPAINCFNGFTSLEFTRLHNFSAVKKISNIYYDIISNALENKMHWIYRSVQAANRDIYIV